MTATLARCTCDSIRENARGQSYSYAQLGVLCPSCEGAEYQEQLRDEWNALTPEQRAQIETARRRDAEQQRLLDAAPPF